MSRELEIMDQMASQKFISDPEHIDRIMKYVLSRRFSHFSKDTHNYEYLRSQLSNGFEISEDTIERMRVADILMLIGYEPGNSYYDATEQGRKRYGRQFNSAGNCRFLGAILKNCSISDIHLKEFMHVAIRPFLSYLQEKVNEEHNKDKISSQARFDMQRQLSIFRRKVSMFMDPDGHRNLDETSIFDLITKANEDGCKAWICSYTPLEEYVGRTLDTYDIINRLFMDCIRMPLVANAGRERFRKIITKCSENPVENLNIDYGKCYEPSKKM